jgi:peptide subunit release factor RF-3
MTIILQLNCRALWARLFFIKNIEVLKMEKFEKNNTRHLALNAERCLTFLAPSEWHLERAMEEWPEVAFHKTMEYDL